MIKTLNKLEVTGNIIKTIYEEPTGSIIISGKKTKQNKTESLTSRVMNKVRVITL